MPTITLTIGLPASGKTTFAKELARKGVVNVNRDDLRKMLFGLDHLKAYKHSGKKEELVTAMQYSIARTALLAGKDVIVSDTNLNPKVRGEWLNFAKEHNAEYLIQDFRGVDAVVCMDRDSRRRDSVGSHVILAMAERYGLPVGTNMPELDYTYEHTDGLPEAIIVDIDGTVARMVDRGPYDQDRVLEDAMEDDVLDLIEAYAKEYGLKIIFLSGRDDKCYADTQEWLDRTQVPYSELFMRETGDARKDDIVKLEIFRTKVAPNYNVVMAFDDRDQVVNMWRQIGLRCVQVNHGNF